MSYSDSFSNSYCNNHDKADDSSTVFDADTVIPDEVPSLPPASQEESPQSFTSVLLRRINSTRHRPAEPSTTTATATVYDVNTVMPDQEESPATATRSEEISTNESSSSSSKKRPIITNSSSHSSRKQPRRSSRLTRQQPQDQSYIDKSDSEVEDENGHEDYEPNEAVINQSSSSSSSQTSTTKGLTKHELRWRSKFEELRAYKQLHGHTNVPFKWKDNKELGEWVNHLRQEYRKMKENKKSSMTSRRIQMLESIDFEWVSQIRCSWNKRFTELKAYKELHGHTNVPRNENKQLGMWMDRQRTHYKKFKKNEKSQITPERVDLLNLIGFEWSPNRSEWNERFTELKNYKEKYGHANVPKNFKDNNQLANWVRTQRRQYKKFQENKKSQITPERINMLNSIGFQWVCQKDESKWNEQFTELKDYKENYGRTNVPQNFKDNKKLANWVNKQRVQYKMYKENKKSQITPERIEMLESIGFQWECHPGRAPRS